jgi:hypothetical protein
MRPAGDLTEHRILRIRAQQPIARLRPRAEQPPRCAVGKAGLADAVGTHQQPGVMQPAALQRVEKCLFGAFQAFQPGGVAGVHEVAHGDSRASTAAQIAAST